MIAVSKCWTSFGFYKLTRLLLEDQKLNGGLKHFITFSTFYLHQYNTFSGYPLFESTRTSNA